MSSANILIEKWLRAWEKSFIYVRKSKGPSIDPCGRTWLFIAYSLMKDDYLCLQILITSLIRFSLKSWENVRFELGSKSVISLYVLRISQESAVRNFPQIPHGANGKVHNWRWLGTQEARLVIISIPSQNTNSNPRWLSCYILPKRNLVPRLSCPSYDAVVGI